MKTIIKNLSDIKVPQSNKETLHYITYLHVLKQDHSYTNFSGRLVEKKAGDVLERSTRKTRRDSYIVDQYSVNDYMRIDRKLVEVVTVKFQVEVQETATFQIVK